MRHTLLLTVAVASLALSGCHVARPNWFHPGPVQNQRYSAIRHDPYADNDAGPEVVGARPREFAKPQAELVRDRQSADSIWRGY